MQGQTQSSGPSAPVLPVGEGTSCLIGRSIDDVDTPALYLDLDLLDRNIARMADVCRRAGIGWRPHAKGHKCPHLALRQIAAGAMGVTCAKLGEAEVMARAGVRDILIANQLFGRDKMGRLVALRKIADPVVTFDALEQAQAASAAATAAGVEIRAIIEVDIGLARAGVPPGQPALDLARAVHSLPGIRFVGLMGYEGHLLTVADLSEKRARIAEAIARLVATRDLLVAAGIACPVVSAGGTGSYAITSSLPGITELQAGGLVMMDVYYRRVCQVTEMENALRVVTSVVSRPTPQRAIVDAGRKTLNAELAMPEVIDRPGVTFSRLSAEHGWLEVSPEAGPLRLGDRLHLVPGYSDFTTVLHDQFLAVRGGVVEDVWPLAARGKLT